MLSFYLFRKIFTLDMRSALKLKYSSPGCIGCGVTPSSLVDGALVSPQPFASMFRVVEILTVLYPTASSPKRRFKRLSLGKKVPTLDQRNFLQHAGNLLPTDTP